MREAPTAIPAQGGRITFPRWLVAADGDTEAARIRQMDELPLLSARDVRKYGEPGKLRGGFVQGGGLPFVAKATKVFGASGLSFEAAAVEITKDGAIAWDEVDTPSPFLRPIKTKRIRTFLNDEPIEGQTGLLVRGAKTGTLDNLILLPSESPLVAHWRGARANRRSTHVHDVDDKGKLDKVKHGPLDFLTVAAFSPVRGHYVPVLCGAEDPEKPATLTGTGTTAGGGGGGTSILGRDSNSGGGESRIDIGGGFRVIPVYDADGRPVGFKRALTGGGTGSSGGGGAGGSTTGSVTTGPRDRRLRYTENGPKGSVHLGQVADVWLVDGESCTLHRYATVVDVEKDASGRAGAISTHHECALHDPVGPNFGTMHKVLGSPKDAPLKYDMADHTGTFMAGRMIETYIRHNPKDTHIHRGKTLPGLWKLETPCVTPPVITPGPKLGGGPVIDPNCLVSPLLMQSAAVSPLPHPVQFGASALTQAVDCWPMTPDAFGEKNFERVSAAPWVGADYGWAEQDTDGQFTARHQRGKQPWNPGGKPASAGGFLRLPASIYPDCRGSSVDYETPRQGSVPTRTDVTHYAVADGYGRLNPMTRRSGGTTYAPGVVDGFTRRMTGSAAARVQLTEAVDGTGTAGASATGLYTQESQTLCSDGGPVTRQLSGDAFTPGNGVDHDLLCETGITDNLATITATNIRTGTVIRLRAAVGTITAVESSNIRVVGTTRVLTGLSTLTLRYDGSLWVEIAYSQH